MVRHTTGTCLGGRILVRSRRVLEEHHESEVHVSLIVAMKEGRSGILRCEIDLTSGVCRNHHDIFVQTGKRGPRETRDFERMPVQMDGVIVRAAVDHLKPVPPSLLEGDCVRVGIGFSIDGPRIERALPMKF